MIDLGRPALHGEGITIFGDHAQPNRAYYLADRPRLRVSPDGIPELMLLKYRFDSALHETLGAGLLSLTVDLGVEPALLEKLRRRLALREGLSVPIELGPVMAESGSCELVLIDRSSRDQDASPGAAPFTLVERIVGAATPSLYGNNAATFLAVLSAEGVALVEGALRGGGLPIGVIYTLQATGLRPSLRAEIAARWKDVYEFYENRLHGGKLLLATDIGPTIEELVHAEAIQISIDELVPESERSESYQRALDQVQRYILDEFFKPTLGQAPPPEDSGDGPLETIGRAIKDFAGFFSLTYSLREVDRNELKTFRYHLGVAQAERLTLAPQGTFGALLGPAADPSAVDRLIVEVEPGPSPEMKFDVASSLDLAAEGIDHLEVSVRYGDREERVLLDAATPRRQVSIWYRQESGAQVTYDYEVQFRADIEGRFDRVRSAPRATDNRVIRLNPRELYQKVVLRVVAKGVPFDRYPSVLVDLRARDLVEGWSMTDTLELSADHLERTFETRAGLNARLRFERRVRYLDTQGFEVVVEWDDADPGILVIGDPLPEVVDVQILGSARFGTEVRRLIVELRPKAEPGKVSTFLLTADNPSATWSWAAGSDASREYEYRVTVHTVRHEVREGQWLLGTPGKLLVGEGIARLRQVEMMLLGPSLKDLGMLAMKIRFMFQDAEAGLLAEDEMLLQDTSKPIRWSYPVADVARQNYTYQLTFIRQDGSTQISDPVTTSDLLVIKTLP